MSVRRVRQSGVALLEALIGILIFSIGILALVAMQATAVNTAADAQYRIEAINLTNHLLSQMWVSTADRSDTAKFQASLLDFAHKTGGAPNGCNFDGGEAVSAVVQDWLTHMKTGRGGYPMLPGATDTMQQIVVDTGSNNRVTITVCWQAPNDPEPRRHTTVAYIN
jgi:type IV pilus assembly protein PilV